MCNADFLVRRLGMKPTNNPYVHSKQLNENIPVNPVTSTSPDHYSKLQIEPWDFIYANNLDFFEGNVVKYICRWKEKGGIEDLQKALTYLEKLIEKN